MTKKIDELAPFQIERKDGKIWIRNQVTGTKGPEFEDNPRAATKLRMTQAGLNSAYCLGKLGV